MPVRAGEQPQPDPILHKQIPRWRLPAFTKKASDMAKFSTTTLAELEELLPNIAQQYHRLALIAGPAGSGKTPLLQELSRRQDTPYLNVNLALSQRLLDLTSKERPLRVRRLLAGVLDEQPGDVVALDNIELLFDPSLHQDPLALLQGLSRVKTLVAAWGGAYVDRVLSYAEPGHPEYRRYERPDVTVFALSQEKNP
jgi:hypothetical protein